MRRRDRQISETRGRYMHEGFGHRVIPTSTEIILPPRARKRPSNKNPIILYPVERRFPLVTFLTHFFSIEGSTWTYFQGVIFPKRVKLDSQKERMDILMKGNCTVFANTSSKPQGLQPHRMIRDGFHTTSGLLGDNPPSLFTASIDFLDLVSDLIASSRKVLREAFLINTLPHLSHPTGVNGVFLGSIKITGHDAPPSNALG